MNSPKLVQMLAPKGDVLINLIRPASRGDLWAHTLMSDAFYSPPNGFDRTFSQ